MRDILRNNNQIGTIPVPSIVTALKAVASGVGLLVLHSLFVGFADQTYRVGDLMGQTVNVGSVLLLMGLFIGVYRATPS